MLVKSIKYLDFDGVEQERVFRFNFTEAELVEWESSQSGGLSKLLEKIIAEQDQTRLIPLFKDMILKAYGEKSTDGQRFVKSQELSKAFSETPAYSVLFMELASNAQAAKDFVNGLVPKKLNAN